MVTDASLFAGGITTYVATAKDSFLADATRGLVGWGAVSLRSMDFKDDSSHQNLAEFVTKIIGLISLALKGYRDFSLAVMGDNMAALSWVRKGRARGSLGRNATLVFARIAIEINVTFTETEHLAGLLNTTCDDLSRERQVSLPAQLRLPLDSDPLVQRALALSDPTFDSTTMAGMRSIWVEAGVLARDVRAASLAARPL
jgi:hypothetical protein